LDSAIEAMGLTKYYGDFLAVDHINFEVKKGEIFGFLGPNGAGIGDTPYTVSGINPFANNIDCYPLMTPFDISSLIPEYPP
jgi:ABC-type uncharacterized transport system ATPase subunit